MEEKQNSGGKFLNPEAIISQLEIERGIVVADFGCGPGYFSLPFAKAVGEEGKVFSLDILPQALETVLGKAKNTGINNIVTKRANLEKENGSGLESSSVDLIILKDILFQNRNKDIIIKDAWRTLKDDGRVLVVEWKAEDQMVGPEAEIRISEAECKKIFDECGFAVKKEIKAGDFHYAFVAIKK